MKGSSNYIRQAKMMSSGEENLNTFDSIYTGWPYKRVGFDGVPLKNHIAIDSTHLSTTLSTGIWCCHFQLGLQYTLQWRHNGRDSVSNHQPHDCLLRRRSKKTSKLHVTGLCAGNSPRTGEFPEQMTSYAENVSIWWRHHEHCASGHQSGVGVQSIFHLFHCYFFFRMLLFVEYQVHAWQMSPQRSMTHVKCEYELKNITYDFIMSWISLTDTFTKW